MLDYMVSLIDSSEIYSFLLGPRLDHILEASLTTKSCCKNPHSEESRVEKLGDFLLSRGSSPLQISIGLGRTAEFLDSYFADWAYK